MPNASQSLDGLSLVEKRMLLAQLLQKKAEQDDVFPLSEGQRGLWYLHQLDPENAAYNMSLPSRVRSKLDVAAFQRCLQALVERHPSLRTTFAEKHGQLVQCVHTSMPVAFELVDARSWSEEKLKKQLDAATQRPFDLARGPLLRTHLYTRGPNDHVILAVAHHIAMDFWSLVVMLSEVRELYPAQCEGRRASLPPLRAAYSDFVRWQADMLAGPKGEELATFWNKRLSGVPHVLELPTDKPRPPLFSHRAGVVPCQIPADLTKRLAALAADEKVTMYSVLLAAFQVLLGNYTGQRDFVVGTPFVGRSRPGFEGTVGYFINMLPMRADLDGNPTFRELLQRVGRASLEALENEDYPFSLIVDQLKVARDSSRPPLVQVSFTLEKSHRQEEAGRGRFLFPEARGHLNVGGLLGEIYYVEQQTCRHEIELVLEQSGGAIQGLFCYCRDLFDDGMIRRMQQHFGTLLTGIVANPDRPLSQLPWYSDDEQRQVIDDWNRTEVAVPQSVCLHQLFEQQVRKTPDAVALLSGDRQYRYRELDMWANRLAARFVKLGVERGDFVALFLDRSPEKVATILATLKAGGVCVPLDPNSPADRLRSMLDDLDARLVVAQDNLLPKLAQGVSAMVVSLNDLEALATEHENIAPPQSGVQPEDLAYVIYTSGSTGEPKGVMVEHRAICNTILWRQRALTADTNERVLMLLPCFFDASFCVIFSTITQGACLVLAEHNDELNPTTLMELIVRRRVTTLPVPPRLLSVLLDHPMIDQCRDVRQVHTGGESMPPDLPRRVMQRLGAPLFNLYGPTETAVEATYWECRLDNASSTVPIGRPIANVQTYVLDADQRPLPVGVPGELYIGGAGLARGYLNDPASTAERFVPHPFKKQTDSRVYRTGDCCRWLADGSLELIGRLDQQVKLRGYRIELTEIEHVLADHPAVSEAAVAVHTNRSGEPQLIAYVVIQDDQELSDDELLRHDLRQKLPTYMLPAQFERLDNLPRTTSGKLDRQALPPPGTQGAKRRDYVAPVTQLECYLVETCQSILHVDRVGMHDSFYGLGGTSIQGAILVASLQEELGERIQTAAMFDLAEIKGLVDYLVTTHPEAVATRFGSESLSNSKATDMTTLVRRSDGTPQTKPDAVAVPSSLLVPIQPDGDRPPLFMVHPPGGIVICYQPLARHLGRNQPLYGIRARGLHGEPELPESVEEMAAEYVETIRSVQPHGAYHLGGWSLGGVIALEMAQQLQAQGERVGLLTFFDTTIPQGAANEAYIAEAEETGLEYGLDITLEQLGELDPDEQLPYLWEHARKLGVIEEGAPEALVQQVLNDLSRLFHAHLRLATDYRMRPYSGRVTLFRPQDAPVDVETSRDRGWSQLIDDVQVHMVPGQHHSMVKDPFVEVLARKLSHCLQNA